MFQRKVYGHLKNWKEESNGLSDFLIEGARRVGKSTTAEEFTKAINPSIISKRNIN